MVELAVRDPSDGGSGPTAGLGGHHARGEQRWSLDDDATSLEDDRTALQDDATTAGAPSSCTAGLPQRVPGRRRSCTAPALVNIRSQVRHHPFTLLSPLLIVWSVNVQLVSLLVFLKMTALSEKCGLHCVFLYWPGKEKPIKHIWS